MDIVLKGRVGIVEGIDEDDQGGVMFTVVIEGDPGLDLGMGRFPGHRFYFRPEEIDPLGEEATEAELGPPAAVEATEAGPRVLVAGLGNIFLGDDGFGVEVARRLADRPAVEGVTVKDFGIRGLDLAYALKDYESVIFVDAVPRGDEPGTLYVIDASGENLGPAGLSTHGMDPVSVLSFAREVGPLPPNIFVVGCQPGVIPDPEGAEVVGDLSAPVRAAVDEAIVQVERLLVRLVDGEPAGQGVS
jgi:hydrogenase maturation protease